MPNDLQLAWDRAHSTLDCGVTVLERHNASGVVLAQWGDRFVTWNTNVDSPRSPYSGNYFHFGGQWTRTKGAAWVTAQRDYLARIERWLDRQQID